MRNLALFLLALLIISHVVEAANSLSDFPVIVRPKVNGTVQPSTTFRYDFVFSSGTSCDVLLNSTATITTDAYGVGSANLNISSLVAVPNYLCEYRNGTLRRIHSLNPNVFRNVTPDNTSWNQTAADNRYFQRSEGVLGNTSWNETRASSIYYPLSGNPNGYLSSYTESDPFLNRSWNQTFADTLYAPISVVGDNSSWSQAVANTLYAPLGSGDNASWNETRANSLYYPLASNPSNYLTTETDPFLNRSWDQTLADTLYAPISVTGDNRSWNETRANSLYAPISVTGDNASWNQAVYWSNASGSFYPLSANPSNYLTSYTETDPVWSAMKASLPNITISQVAANLGNWSNDRSLFFNTSQGVLDNQSWNQTLADTLYAPISVTGDNSSWSESRANTLYATITTVSDNQSWNETRALALFCQPDGTNCPASNGDNSSWNQTLANTLYLGISSTAANSNQLGGQVPSYFLNTTGGTYDNRSWNETRAVSLFAPIGVTGDNSSWNETRANALYYPLSSNPSNYLTSYTETDPVWSAMKSSLPNLTLGQISTNLGNWSLDKSSYTTTASGDTRYVRNSTVPTCTGNDKLTSSGNGVLTCATDQTSGGTVIALDAVNRSDVDASTNVSTAWVKLNVTLSLPATRNITVECSFIGNTSATTTGLQIMFNYTGGRNVMNTYEYFSSATAKSSAGGLNNLTVLATAGQGTPIGPSFYVGGIETTSAGTFDVYFKTEVPGSFVTIYRGSACKAFDAT